MPILRTERRKIEYLDEGRGAPVVLLHCSASSNQQWQALATALRPQRRVIAPNLFGYGATSPWPGRSRLRVEDCAELVLDVLDALDGGEGPVDFVGHSFGALVALIAAGMAPGRARRLVLFEPNPFALLGAAGRDAEYREVAQLHAHIRGRGATGDWDAVAEAFADYFAGDGSWAAMPAGRRAALAGALAPNLHEWDAVMDPALRLPGTGIGALSILLVAARDSRPALRATAQVLRSRHPDWQFQELARGGHLAPLVRPRAFNDLVARFLCE